ncbi:uncharacterized protein LOC132612837 [Lycium barbarum]|uniref:uncharacterized protein LOC132612837 n=1 Tax=Lycium barbarum TaxID=112863 RepID=UPI00293F65D6|nr:uncharacterized protein LOC132612837 [Lycium barbarum]
MVLSWLLNSLSKEIAESVLYSKSAKELWSDLEDRYGQANGAKLFQLQKELSAVVQGNSSVSAYFTKMKSLSDELEALNTYIVCSCECKCGSKTKTLKAIQDGRLLQFLMGLNEVFIGVRSNILLTAPLPSIKQAYCLSGGHRRFNDNRGHKAPYDAKKNTPVCTYCKKIGHTIDKCYKIHGFPPDFKFTKSKKFQHTTHVNNALGIVEGYEQAGSSSGNPKSLTQENIRELLQLLQQMKLGKQTVEGSETPANANCAVHKLCKQLQQNVLFTSTSCFLQGPSMKKPLEIGKEVGGLYFVKTSLAAAKFKPSIASSSHLVSSRKHCLASSASIFNSNKLFQFQCKDSSMAL